MSHRASLLGRGYQDRHLDSPRVRFKRALLLCLMTIGAPGSAQVAVGNKWVGRVALFTWLCLIGLAGFLGWKYFNDRATFLGYFTDSDKLAVARLTLVGLAIAWLALFIVLAASLVTAAAVAFSGIIGFIGLTVPHLLRSQFGADYRLLLPLSMLGGAIALLLADILARTVIAPQELPVGIITALVGGPFFIWVMRSAAKE